MSKPALLQLGHLTSLTHLSENRGPTPRHTKQTGEVACQSRTMAHIVFPESGMNEGTVRSLDMEKGVAHFGQYHFLGLAVKRGAGRIITWKILHHLCLLLCCSGLKIQFGQGNPVALMPAEYSTDWYSWKTLGM